jgi:adenylylsulfate kinase
MIYYFTGQPGAGKTTLGKLLIEYLISMQTFEAPFMLIDGDDIRHIFDNHDYSEEGRRKNVQRAQDIAQFINEQGCNAVITLVSPYRDLRDDLKSKSPVMEIYVHTSEIRGKEHFHVKDYEPPIKNFVDINTTNSTIKNSLSKIIDLL